MPKSNKKLGFYVVIAAAILCLAAGIYFKVIDGTFGLRDTHNGKCFDALTFGLLIGGPVVSAVLLAIRQYGLASFAVTAASGVSIALFVHKCYWYVTDVFVGIDEPKGQFDPKFMIFVGLMAAAFLVGEISVYLKKSA